MVRVAKESTANHSHLGTHVLNVLSTHCEHQDMITVVYTAPGKQMLVSEYQRCQGQSTHQHITYRAVAGLSLQDFFTIFSLSKQYCYRRGLRGTSLAHLERVGHATQRIPSASCTKCVASNVDAL